MINSRAKGARYERMVAQFLREHGYEARRGCQFSGSADSPDVVSDFPCHIEAKFVERLNIVDAYKQSERDSGDKPPCVIHKKKQQKFHLITLNLEDFINLIQTHKNNEQ